MLFTSSGASLVAAFLLAVVGPAAAVCAPGQLVLGVEGLTTMTSTPGSLSGMFYSGFMGTNNCDIVAQNGITQSPDQLCFGDYNNGASVHCQNGSPDSAIDSKQQKWTCKPVDGLTCPHGVGAGGYFRPTACCDRA